MKSRNWGIYIFKIFLAVCFSLYVGISYPNQLSGQSLSDIWSVVDPLYQYNWQLTEEDINLTSWINPLMSVSGYPLLLGGGYIYPSSLSLSTGPLSSSAWHQSSWPTSGNSADLMELLIYWQNIYHTYIPTFDYKLTSFEANQPVFTAIGRSGSGRPRVYSWVRAGHGTLLISSEPVYRVR